MEISKQNYLAHLNKNQKEAIIDLEGPCLIVAELVQAKREY